MIGSLFSSRYIFLKLSLTVAVVALSCLYSYTYGPRQNIYYSDCLDHPAQCEGKRVLAVVGIVTSVEEKGFKMSVAGGEITVKGKPAGISNGKYLDVAGVFRGKGYMELEDYHLYLERKIKIYVSVIPVIVVGWLLAKNFLLTSRRRSG